MPLGGGGVGSSTWRARIFLIGLLLVFYLIAAVFISGLSDIQPGFSTRVFRHGQLISGKNGPNPGGTNIGTSGIYRSMVGRGMVPIRRLRLQWCSGLKFIEPPSSIITALVSFPGSGNTWLRYLIQQATGIYTGSIYTDYGLIKNGFPAENVVDGTVIVVKTHMKGANERQKFNKAILLLRSPAKAIQAEFNRQSGGHVGYAPPEHYRRQNGAYWKQFVAQHIQTWRVTCMDWLKNFTGPLHIVFYEKLVSDVEHTLTGIIRFLNLDINETLLKCAVNRQEGIYRRHKRIIEFNPFTQHMKMLMATEEAYVLHTIFTLRGRVTTNDQNFFVKYRQQLLINNYTIST